jgi:hypothetical protein
MMKKEGLTLIMAEVELISVKGLCYPKEKDQQKNMGSLRYLKIPSMSVMIVYPSCMHCIPFSMGLYLNTIKSIKDGSALATTTRPATRRSCLLSGYFDTISATIALLCSHTRAPAATESPLTSNTRPAIP